MDEQDLFTSHRRNSGSGITPSRRNPSEYLTPSKYKRSYTRYERGTVVPTSPTSYIVNASSSLGDRYDEYEVERGDNNYFKCSCQEHAGGQYRNLCTHIGAVLIYEFWEEPWTQDAPSAYDPSTDSTDSTEGGNGIAPSTDQLIQQMVTEASSTPTTPPSPQLPTTENSSTETSTTRKKPRKKPEFQNSPAATSTTTSTTSSPSPRVAIPALSAETTTTVPVSHYSGVYPAWVDSFRSFQPSLSDEILSGLEHHDLVLFQGPPGSGKSLIANMVQQKAALERTVTDGVPVLCVDRYLQDQYLRDFGEVGSVTMKGRANYIPQIPKSADGVDLTCNDCDFGDGSCSFCPVVKECPYRIAKDTAVRSPFPVLNYAYFLREANGGRPAFSNRQLIIADECDEIEDLLCDYADVTFSWNLRKSLGLGQPTKLDDAPQEWYQWLDEHVIPRLEMEVGKRRDALRQNPTSVALRRRLNGMKERLLEAMRLREGIDQGEWILDGYERRRGKGERKGPLVFKPVRVAEVAQQVLWPHSKKWVLQSATIVNPQEMVETLGWEKPYAVVDGPMTFPLNSRKIYASPVGDMRFKTQDQALPQVIEAVNHILDQWPGERAIIHTVSFRLTQLIKEGLDTHRKIFTYKRGEALLKDATLQEFFNTDEAILIGPSIHRGTDFKYDRARINIIVKMPYPNTQDKRVNARMRGPGGKGWYASKTVRTLIQTFGRTTRAADDWSVTYLLDSAFFDMFKTNKSLFPQYIQDALDPTISPAAYKHQRELPNPIER